MWLSNEGLTYKVVFLLLNIVKPNHTRMCEAGNLIKKKNKKNSSFIFMNLSKES